MKKIIAFINLFLLYPLVKVHADWGDGMTAIGEFGLSTQEPEGIIEKLLLWLLSVLAILSVLAFVISGVMFLISGGNEKMTSQAKDYIKYSVIGLVVALCGYIIVKFINDVLMGSYYL
jgi:hypothetical protein